jgi:aminopeptidase N
VIRDSTQRTLLLSARTNPPLTQMVTLMRTFLVFLAWLAWLAAYPLYAQELFPVRDEGETRNRDYDVLHYKIEVSFDEAQRKVMGTVSTTLVPFTPGLTHVIFDAEEMTIDSVSLARGKTLTFTTGPKTLDILLDRMYSYRDTITVVTHYWCTPRRGLFFIQPDSAYPHVPWQIWTQGEDMDNHFWFPCYDFPNDRATTEVLATVRSSYTALSNGKLLGVTEDRKKGTKTFHWKESKPHVAYLVMLAIGEYAVLKDTVGKLPLEYYVYPEQVDDARICFRPTPDVMTFFSRVTGVPFPWEKYAQVLIHDFTVGGMENTSACSLLDHATVYDARQRVDHSSSSLIAHELAHQWWGDLVTCKDWRHLWLNESFASYFDLLYHEYSLGRDEFDYSTYEAQQAGINNDKTLGRKPIVSVGSYGANLYPRGASVLHMLRYLLGDSLYFRSLHHYLIKHQYGVVETNDLKVAIEESTGQNLYWFFDQWVYKAGYPIFAVSSTWVDSTKQVRLHVEQTQRLDSLTVVFRTPVDIEITTAAQRAVHRVEILTRDTVFVFPAAEKPRMVLFDEGNWLLKETRFDKSDEEWLTQLREARNPINRLLAAKHLGLAASGQKFVPALIDRIQHDPFWAVRRESITMLGLSSSSTDSSWTGARAALIGAARDSKPAVRAAAVALLTDSADAGIRETLRAALNDSTYTVVAQALRALAKADPRGSIGIFGAHLGMPSHQDIISTTALDALASADSLLGIAAAKECLHYGTPQPLRRTAFWVLRRFIRSGTVPESTLYALTTDKSVILRTNAVRALGDLGTGQAIPVLEAVLADPRNPAADAARKSIERIKQRLATPHPPLKTE